MATLLPNGKQQFIDANGNPLGAGTVAFYVPGTTTPKDTYQDSAATILNTNPITLDAAGEAIIYGSGGYRQQVFDSAGNLIWDVITADTAVGGTAQGGTSTGTPNAQVVNASSFAQINEQQLVFIVGAGLTNTGGTTVAPGGGSGIPVLKDTASGPAALTGGELVTGNAYLLTYDIVRGAFHVNATPQSQPTTFQDNQFRIFNASDNTRKIAFDASGITTGDTRTYVAPDTNGTLLLNNTVNILKGHLFGLALANDGVTPNTVIDIAAGEAASDDSFPFLMILASAFTKSIASVWVAGSGNGGLDTGSVTNGSYHVYQIATAAGVADVLISASATSPTMPSGWIYKRRIGSIVYSSGIKAFAQHGNDFYWNTSSPPTDFSGSTRGKSALSVTLPSGIVVQGHFQVKAEAGSSGQEPTATVFDGVNTNIGVSLAMTAPPTNNIIGPLDQYTNTSAQVQLQVTSASASSLVTLGWTDTRGR